MNSQKDYGIAFTVNPEEVFTANNNVQGWWDGLMSGDLRNLNTAIEGRK